MLFYICEAFKVFNVMLLILILKFLDLYKT